VYYLKAHTTSIEKEGITTGITSFSDKSSSRGMDFKTQSPTTD